MSCEPARNDARLTGVLFGSLRLGVLIPLRSNQGLIHGIIAPRLELISRDVDLICAVTLSSFELMQSEST